MKDLRISVIDRCNFRCPYCMPKETYGDNYKFLGSDKYLNFDEIDRLVRILVDEGVRKIRLTGGEPLLRPNLFHLVSKLSKIPQNRADSRQKLAASARMNPPKALLLLASREMGTVHAQTA